MLADNYRITPEADNEDSALSILRDEAIDGLVTEEAAVRALILASIPDNLRDDAKAKFNELKTRGSLTFEAQGEDPR